MLIIFLIFFNLIFINGFNHRNKDIEFLNYVSKNYISKTLYYSNINAIRINKNNNEKIYIRNLEQRNNTIINITKNNKNKQCFIDDWILGKYLKNKKCNKNYFINNKDSKRQNINNKSKKKIKIKNFDKLYNKNSENLLFKENNVKADNINKCNSITKDTFLKNYKLSQDKNKCKSEEINNITKNNSLNKKKKVNKKSKRKSKDFNIKKILNNIKSNNVLNNTISNNTKINKTIIPIIYATDNRYIYPTIISMTSLCDNANKNTLYNIYILLSKDIFQINKEKLKSVGLKYINICNITLINMKNAFENAKTDYRITTAAYYKLYSPSLFPQYEKIIFLDGDTIILHDLTEMYLLNISNLYYMGHTSVQFEELNKFKINSNIYLCSGVLLINNKELIKDNIQSKFDEFINKYNNILTFHDQTTINCVCKEKLGLLPAKYGIYNLGYRSQMKRIQKFIQKNKITHSKEDIIEALKDPYIIHFNIHPKPWKNKNKNGINTLFWYYVNMTNFNKEIIERYNNYLKIKDNYIKYKHKKNK